MIGIKLLLAVDEQEELIEIVAYVWKYASLTPSAEVYSNHLFVNLLCGLH